MRIVTLPRIRYHKYYTGQILRTLLGIILAVSDKYDIVHGFAVAQPSTGIPTMICRYLKNGHIIVDWDDLWGEGFAEFHNILTKKILEILEKKIPHMAEKVTVVSDLLIKQSMAIGLNKENVIKIPNGSDIERIKPIDKLQARKKLNLKTNAPILVSVGHTFLRGYNIFFKAFSLVIREVPNAKLLLIGNIELSDEIMKVFEEISRNVILKGVQAPGLIPYYLAAADVLILPMDDNIIEKARWPIRLGDYLASGKAIVSNAVGEVKKVLTEDNCGLTASPTDPKDFAEKIVKLLENEELRTKLGKQARKVAEEKYSWIKITERLNQVYMKL
jgi:glycosyltransferase involved in cell wall biosynthesis